MIKSLKSVGTIIANTSFKGNSLVCVSKFNVSDQHWPKTWFFGWTPQQKKFLYSDRPIPKMNANFYDTLSFKKVSRSSLLEVLNSFLQDQEVTISHQKCAMLLYNFSKQDLLIPQAEQKIEKFLYRYKGQYSSRSCFGGIYAALCINNKKMLQFFMAQYEACQTQMLPNQCFQIIIALNKNTSMKLQQKHAFWQAKFKDGFISAFPSSKQRKISKIFQMFQTFEKFQYYDAAVWDKLFQLMDNKGGWIRTVIIQKIHNYIEIHPRAKQIFDKYYNELSTNRNVMWRYNLQQLRLYSSQEMRGKSQQNIELSRQHLSIWKDQREAEQKQARYREYLQKGQVVEEDGVIKDKAQSLAYAMKARFEAMKKDGVDFTQLKKQEFEDLFGQYDQELMKEKPDQQGQQEQQTLEQQNSQEVQK